MANKTYRLNNIIKNSIHKPYIKGDSGPLVLYKKVPEYRGEEDNIAKSYTEDSKFGKYMSMIDKSYNSPRNIRRLFITGSKVAIQYYHSPFINGKDNGSNWSEGGYIGNSIKDILEDLKNIKSGVTINGNPFSALVEPLMCSNIDEVYIDKYVIEAMYNSNSIMQEVCNQSTLGASKIRKMLVSVINNSNIVCTSGEDSRLPYDMLQAGIGSKIEQLQLVQSIGIIGNLEEILEDTRVNKSGDFLKNIELEKSYWWKDNVEVIKEHGGVVIISQVGNTSSIVQKFSSAPNIYEYDRQVLSGVFERYTNKYNELLRVQRYKQYGYNENGEQTGVVSIEDVIKQLEEKYGRGKAERIVMLAASECSRKELEETVSTFSIGEFRNRYTKLLRIKE